MALRGSECLDELIIGPLCLGDIFDAGNCGAI